MKWTKEKCHEIALKYQNKRDFSLYDNNAYFGAFRHGYLNEICSHMIQLCKPSGYWTKEKCHELALKYDTKTSFLKNHAVVYSKAYNQGFLNEICSHMKTIGHIYKRCIYSVEFDDNSVYIGLTFDINKREKEHLKEKNSTVYKYIENTKLIPKFKQISDYIDKDEASKLEEYTIQEYRNNNWNILNKIKGGSLGSKNIIITKEQCHKIALKYNTIKDLKYNNINIYNISIKRKWIKDITTHMIELKKPANYWSFEKCKEESLKYNNKSQFWKNSSSAYYKSIKMKWINLFFPTSKC